MTEMKFIHQLTLQEAKDRLEATEKQYKQYESEGFDGDNYVLCHPEFGCQWWKDTLDLEIRALNIRIVELEGA